MDIKKKQPNNKPSVTPDTSKFQGSNQDDNEILGLLKENLAISRELLKTTKKVNRFLVMQKTWFLVKILLIIVPLILGAIYLPPLLAGVIEQYQSLLNIK